MVGLPAFAPLLLHQTLRRSELNQRVVVTAWGCFPHRQRCICLCGRPAGWSLWLGARDTFFDAGGYRFQEGCEVKGFRPESTSPVPNCAVWTEPHSSFWWRPGKRWPTPGLDFAREESTRCGVVLGHTLGGMISGEAYHRGLKQGRPRPSDCWISPCGQPWDQVAIASRITRGEPAPVHSLCRGHTRHRVCF